MRTAGAIEVARERHELRVLAGARARRGDGVLAVADMVYEMRIERLLRRERPLIDELPHLTRLEPASLRDATHHLLEDRMQQGVGFLAMRRRHLGLGQDVHRRLVLGAMLEAWLDAELVERAAEERHLDAQAHQPDLAEGLQPQLVE